MSGRIVAFFLIVILLPLFVVISFFVFYEDGFPVLFKQKRIGKGNSYFYIYKFRTMKLNTPNLATHLLSNPERYMLKSGSFIRKSSLDELPNLFNIFKGDMCFVGPRPALYNQHDLIGLRALHGINCLKPGLTGWAQINGRDELSIKEKISFEKEYMLKKSFLFDLNIVILTFLKVFSKTNIKH
jgi:O-antigen biosynthesis protein WbqP